MKFMTETREGGRIVEMSAEEVKAFRQLVLAVEGGELNDVYNGGFTGEWQHFYSADHPDMSKTFNVIAEWVRQKCNLNEMEHVLSGLRKALGENEPR